MDLPPPFSFRCSILSGYKNTDPCFVRFTYFFIFSKQFRFVNVYDPLVGFELLETGRDTWLYFLARNAGVFKFFLFFPVFVLVYDAK